MTIQFPHMPEQVTRSEAEIIDYISNNPREFLQDSIGAVSRKLGVSGTTLSRFARRVGCGDYKGLKRLVVPAGAACQSGRQASGKPSRALQWKAGCCASSSIWKRPWRAGAPGL